MGTADGDFENFDPRNTTLADLHELSSRFHAIPGIEKTFNRFNNFVTEMERAEDEDARFKVMIKYLASKYVN